MRGFLKWTAFLVAVAVPIVAAAFSPLLAWREPIYIVAGFAGVVGMALLLTQPLLVAGLLPGIPRSRGRHMHRWVGTALLLSVMLHVAALWITSPPDVVDALLFVAPTPFSAWGVIAMWAVFVAALIAALRRWLNIQPRTWRRIHTTLATVIVAGSVIHAMLIEGTMETISKTFLCALVIFATLKALGDLKVWTLWRPTP